VIRRRALLVLAGLAAGALGSRLSRAADPAQRIVRVGFVIPNSPSTAPDGFGERLGELGWVEGQNLVIETRSAGGQVARLPALMTEVIGRNIDVLVTFGTRSAIAAKNATTTIPIVAITGDPVRAGLVASLAHPGGNLTGLSMGWAEGMAGKRLELLQETVPHLSTVAMIGTPDNPMVREMARELEAVGPTRRLTAKLIEVREPEALDRVFKQARRQAQAVLILGDILTFEYRRQIAALAARYRLPAMYPSRDYLDSGGLMAHGVDNAILYRGAADYVDKILKGAKPADLPIEQPTKYLLVVNVKTAKALGITIPESILLRADEVIR
jgi:putative ABC transport system substrate-binding protein